MAGWGDTEEVSFFTVWGQRNRYAVRAGKHNRRKNGGPDPSKKDRKMQRVECKSERRGRIMRASHAEESVYLCNRERKFTLNEAIKVLNTLLSITMFRMEN